MLYAIIALAALAVLCGWLVWCCVSLRGTLAKTRARVQSLQKDRAIRRTCSTCSNGGSRRSAACASGSKPLKATTRRWRTAQAT